MTGETTVVFKNYSSLFIYFLTVLVAICVLSFTVVEGGAVAAALFSSN